MNSLGDNGAGSIRPQHNGNGSSVSVTARCIYIYPFNSVCPTVYLKCGNLKNRFCNLVFLCDFAMTSMAMLDLS